MEERESGRKGWPFKGWPIERFLRRTPKQSRSKAVVESLVQSLDEFMQRGRGVEDVAIDTLLDRAGVGIGSFYEYFSNKEGLLGVLIGQAMKHNFDHLLAAVEAADHTNVERLVEQVSQEVAATFFTRPERTQFIWVGILRLGLFPVVLKERDRFARELADHAAVLLPEEPPDALFTTLRAIVDGSLGIVNSAVFREPPPTIQEAAELTHQLAMGLLRARHPSCR